MEDPFGDSIRWNIIEDPGLLLQGEEELRCS